MNRRALRATLPVLLPLASASICEGQEGAMAGERVRLGAPSHFSDLRVGYIREGQDGLVRFETAGRQYVGIPIADIESLEVGQRRFGVASWVATGLELAGTAFVLARIDLEDVPDCGGFGFGTSGCDARAKSARGENFLRSWPVSLLVRVWLRPSSSRRRHGEPFRRVGWGCRSDPIVPEL